MTEIKSFPEIRGLMAKYGKTQQDMGDLIGNTYRTFGSKLDGTSEFKFSDMWKIRDFFKSKGENISIEALFFNWKFTNVNKGSTEQKPINEIS